MQKQQEQRLDRALTARAAVLGALLAALAGGAVAQIRVYDEATGQSSAAPGLSGMETVPVKSDKKDTGADDAKMQETLPKKEASSGVRIEAVKPHVDLQNTPVQPPQTSKFPPAKTGPTTSGGLNIEKLTKNPLQEILEEEEAARRKTYIFVFVDVSEFSPIVASRVAEVARVPNVEPLFYVSDMSAEEYLALSSKGLEAVPRGVRFKTDRANQLAQAYGVKGSHTIVIRTPEGAIRRYDLVREIELFKRHINRMVGGSAT